MTDQKTQEAERFGCLLREVAIVWNRVAAERDAAKAECARLQWQRIETAPKAGIFLGVIEYASGKFGEPFVAWWDPDDEIFCARAQTEIAPHEPTHWMPIPPLPAEQR